MYVPKLHCSLQKWWHLKIFFMQHCFSKHSQFYVLQSPVIKERVWFKLLTLKFIQNGLFLFKWLHS